MKKDRKLKPYKVEGTDGFPILIARIEPDPHDNLKVSINSCGGNTWLSQRDIKRLIKWLEKAAAQ